MKKILFIGNSHTYFNDMPAMVKALADGCNNIDDVDITMLAHPYKTLDYHINEKEVRFNILYGNYDYVVLQQGAHPFSGEEELIKCSKEINKLIKDTGAIPVAYMTWAQKSEPEKQEEMTKAYINMAKEIGGILAPVGMVFEDLRESHPEIGLYYEDGAHAGPIGSYIAAATIVSAIFKVNPETLTSKVECYGKILCKIEDSTSEVIKETIKKYI